MGALPKLVETTYHGAMIGWALHREGSLPVWMRDQLVAVLGANARASSAARSPVETLESRRRRWAKA